MERKKILVLFGGCSPEHDVSLQSAAAVLAALEGGRWEAVPVGITRAGRWLRFAGPVQALADGTWESGACTPCTLPADRGAGRLLLFPRPGAVEFERVDAVFPVLHGRGGEDGTVQGLAELAGLPLVGCGTLASALCMDKDRAHRLAAQAGVAVPRAHVFRQTDTAAAVEMAGRELGFPLFVKPVRAGSSFGVARVACPQALPDAMARAFTYDDFVLLEQAVPGFEVGCAVLGSDVLTVGEVDEIELAGGFFDYEEKYTLRTSRIHMPARLCAADAARVKNTAVTLYRALGCRGFARVDLFFTPGGEIVFNEINTIPGFTAHSRYPGMMRGAGLSFPELVDRLITLELGQ